MSLMASVSVRKGAALTVRMRKTYSEEAAARDAENDGAGTAAAIAVVSILFQGPGYPALDLNGGNQGSP